MRSIVFALAALLTLAAGSLGTAEAKTLRFGLAEDPDILDPTLGRTYVGRMVFAALCDKLLEIDPDLNFVPQLATSYEWAPENRAVTFHLRKGVSFHDGTPFNAEAVKFNIERNLTFPGSNRKGEIAAVEGATVIDALTVRLDLKTPFVPLLGALSDRGMMVSPTAAKAAGPEFGNRPVCAGPFKFVERVQQDRIVVDKFDGYWDKDRVHLDRIVFRPIADAAVRLANLRSGDLDFVERIQPTDIQQVKSDPKLRLAEITSIGYQGITINLNNGERAKSAIGSDPKVREAFELSLDRNAINQVVFNGEFTPGNQWVPPGNKYHADWPMPARNVERAKALLKEAGKPNPVVNLMVPNGTEAQQVGQVIQQLAREAGFDVRLEVMEFASALARSSKGDFEAFLIGWSGASDVDRNIYAMVHCTGSLNDSKYCNPEVDRLLDQERMTADLKGRVAALGKIAQLTTGRDRPLIYLYHQKWFYGMSQRLSGYVPYPDGVARVSFTDLN
ncbi:MAG: ABC transporter substrate-binding protein [Proteobacteria bacterium]|nr:ABC transporter substrate-binding protein [Pseudomonadota bacterium]MBI3498189.1 ABC transporter substrate-binding protein [Pseudomonadota bacterium]